MQFQKVENLLCALYQKVTIYIKNKGAAHAVAQLPIKNIYEIVYYFFIKELTLIVSSPITFTT